MCGGVRHAQCRCLVLPPGTCETSSEPTQRRRGRSPLFTQASGTHTAPTGQGSAPSTKGKLSHGARGTWEVCSPSHPAPGEAIPLLPLESFLLSQKQLLRPPTPTGCLHRVPLPPPPAAVALWNSPVRRRFDLQHTWSSVPRLHPPAAMRVPHTLWTSPARGKGWQKPHSHQASSSSAVPGSRCHRTPLIPQQNLCEQPSAPQMLP